MTYAQKNAEEDRKEATTTHKTMRRNIDVKLSPGMHQMSVFGDEFADASFCWMVGDELWLSMIIVKESFRMPGTLHNLLDAAKDANHVVVIPEPLGVVPGVAAKHGYMPSTRWIEECGENINIMEWRDAYNIQEM